MQARFSLSLLLLPMALTLKINTAHAQTNTMDGSFRYSLDLFQKQKLQLTYNSRSLFEGIFGLGWCSNLDEEIKHCKAKLPKKNSLKVEKLKTGFQISSGGETAQLTIQNGLLKKITSRQGIHEFKYDKNSNLSIARNKTKLEMIRYDEQDRVIGHHFANGCFDQISYDHHNRNQFVTDVLRSCPQKPKEKLLYVFSVKTNKKQQREISSVQIDRKVEASRISELP